MMWKTRTLSPLGSNDHCARSCRHGWTGSNTLVIIRRGKAASNAKMTDGTLKIGCGFAHLGCDFARPGWHTNHLASWKQTDTLLTDGFALPVNLWVQRV